MDISQLHLDWGSSRYKGKVYRSYSLARAVWKDGKNTKEPVIKLGKLSEAEVTQWRQLLTALKDPSCFLTSFDEICVEKHYAYLDVAIANAIWDDWGLDAVFAQDGKRRVRLATVARILTLNRCIEPCAKSTTPEWFRDTALPWLLDLEPSLLNASRIFRELAVIERHKEAICRFLFDSLSASAPSSMTSLFYDLSSTSFAGTHCKLMKWGHCKGGYENHVVLALVVNKDGFPFYWEVLPGGTADATTLQWLLERLQQIFGRQQSQQITFVFDRGMVSDANLSVLEAAGIKYITAMDKNQIATVTAFDFTAFSAREQHSIEKPTETLPGFTRIHKNLFCRETGVDGQRRYILCFNPHLFTEQRRARTRALTRFQAAAKTLNAELRKAKKSRQRKPTCAKFKKLITRAKVGSFVEVKLRLHHVFPQTDGATQKIRTYQATVTVDTQKMALAGQQDGFWLLVTNHAETMNQAFSLSMADAVTPYREKELIEEAFKNIKSFVKIEPLFVWTDDHVKAHYTICVLAYLLNRTLTRRLHTNAGNTSGKIVTHHRLFKETSQCQLDYIEVKNIHQKKFTLTTPTSTQKELLQRVELPQLLNRKLVKKANAQIHYAE